MKRLTIAATTAAIVLLTTGPAFAQAGRNIPNVPANGVIRRAIESQLNSAGVPTTGTGNGSLADQAMKHDIPVYFTSKPTRYGDELVTLQRADEPRQEPLTADEIPF